MAVGALCICARQYRVRALKRNFCLLGRRYSPHICVSHCLCLYWYLPVLFCLLTDPPRGNSLHWCVSFSQTFRSLLHARLYCLSTRLQAANPSPSTKPWTPPPCKMCAARQPGWCGCCPFAHIIECISTYLFKVEGQQNFKQPAGTQGAPQAPRHSPCRILHRRPYLLKRIPTANNALSRSACTEALREDEV